ncbi:hypothetical protein [Actinomadura oligospora]|uniref:hypothetical protein n=1 Tax=Actinomadura oligospora TaxID=111804 RepID=UPI0004B690DB|nr:hypothetical protein [Actinomadura oligospora]
MAAVLVGVSLLTGCGSKADGVDDLPSATALPPGQGGDQLVLRWRMTGGMAGLGGPWTVPDLSLYADGTAIVPGKPGRTSRLQRYHLKRAVAQRFFDEARKAGLQRSRKVDTKTQVADAMVLVIWMGSAKTEIVMPQEQHIAATALWKKLQPDQWSTGDQQSPPDVYRPDRLAVSALDTGEHPAPPGAIPWPLSPLGKGRQLARGGLCTIYTGGDAARLRELASKADLGARFSSGGKVYMVRVRPLLPDEKSCDALV